MTVEGSLPPFFIPGEGPTALRQVLLGTALVLFSLSSVTLMWLCAKSKSEILYWYSLALGALATSLLSFFVLRNIGDLLNWAGRFATYVTGLCFLASILTTVRQVRLAPI